jgi:hypothetical protein
MNRPPTLLISLVLLAMLSITTLITLIAYSPTFNRPFARMLQMIDPTVRGLPPRQATVVLGQDDFTSAVANRSLATGLNAPAAVAVDRSVTPPLIWVADTGNHRVLGYVSMPELGPDSVPDHVVGQADLETATPGAGRGGLNTPVALAVDDRGGLYIADQGNNRVVYFERPYEENAEAGWLFGQPDWESTAAGDGPDGLHHPTGVALDAEGNLFIADTGNDRVLRLAGGIDGEGVADRVWGRWDAAEGDVAGLSGPTGLAIRGDGMLAVADTGNDRVVLFDVLSDDGEPVSELGNRVDEGGEGDVFRDPRAVAFLHYGLLVADTGNHRVLYFPRLDRTDADARWGWEAEAPEEAAPSEASFREPSGLAVDGEGSLLVADRGHHRVLIFRR